MSQPPHRMVAPGSEKARGDAAIEVRDLAKTFGAVRAVDNLTFSVAAGTVTGFLGPNGAGKTTTLRILLGLVRPDAGTATINGRSYAELPAPASDVGAALEATGFHPARTGRAHLRVYCTVSGYPPSRADEVLEQVGLTSAGGRPVRGYSLGMRQRLTLAAALLGDPDVLILDEPANGLDPEGIVWLRGLLRELAAQGRTVLVSSHVLTEMQHLVDSVVIIDKGRLVYQGLRSDLAAAQESLVDVRTPHVDELQTALAARGGVLVQRTAVDRLLVTGADAADVGRIAFAANAEVLWLAERTSDLEDLFFSLTRGESA